MSREQVFYAIRNKGLLTKTLKLTTLPSKRSPKKYCAFHEDYRRYTVDYFNLREQIHNLINNECLTEFMLEMRRKT